MGLLRLGTVPTPRALAVERVGSWWTLPRLALAAGIGLVAAAFRLYELGTPSVWLDEAISLWGAALPWRDLIPQLASRDESPPLYFALLHVWTAWGDGEAWVRLLSVLCSLAAVALGGWLAARLAGPPAGWIAALFLALAPPQIFYAQEARMYALVVALTLAAAHCALTVLRGGSRRWAVIWGALAAATAATHYTAALAVAALFLGAGVVALASRSRGRIASVALAGIVAVVAWLPVAPMFAMQSRLVAAHYWIPRPTLEYTVAELLGATIGGPPPAAHVQLSDPIALARPIDLVPASMAVLRAGPLRRISLGLSHNAFVVLPALLSLALVGLAAVRARAGWPVALVVGAVVALPPLALLAVSQVRPLLLARAMLGSGTLAVVLAAIGCAALPRLLRWPLVALLVWHFLLGGGEHWWYPGGEEWRRAAARIAAESRPDDLLLVDGRWMELPLRYYLKRTPVRAPELHGVPVDFAVQGKPEPVTTDADVPRLMALAHDRSRAWLVLSHTADTDPQLLARRALETEFQGCFQVWPYQAVTVLRFERCAG